MKKGRALASALLLAGLGWLSGVAQQPVDLEKLRTRAEQSDVEAQNMLGNAYNEGRGVQQDQAEALRWFRRAAEKGYAPAQYNLGLAYEQGHGVPADDKQAFKYYLMAAEQGFGAAQFNVGNMYAVGRGIGQDLFESNLWFKQAAEKGIIEAQFNLGLAYEAGRGVRKDEAQAARWYKQAADRGFPRAQYNLGLLLEDGRGVTKNETAAAGYYRAAAEQGFAAAQNNYGLMISEGRGGLAKDPIQAWVWLSLAAENGSNPAARDFVARGLDPAQQAAATKLLEERKAGKATPSPVATAAAAPAPARPVVVPPTVPAGPDRMAELAAALAQAREANTRLGELNQRLELEKIELQQQINTRPAPGGVEDSAKLIEQLRAQSQRLAAQVQSLATDKDAAEREVTLLRTQVRDAQQDSAKAKSAAPAADVSRYETQAADLTAKLQQATASLAQLKADNRQLTEGNARLQKEKDDLAASAAPASETAPAAGLVANLQRDNARLNDEVKRATRELLSLNTQLRQLRNQPAAKPATSGGDDKAGSEQLAQLNAKLEQVSQDAVRLQAENGRLAARVTELENQPKPAPVVDGAAVAQLAEARQAVDRLQKQVAGLQADKAELEKWSRSLEQTVNEKSVLAEGAGANLAELKQKFTQVQQQLGQTQADNRALTARVTAAERATQAATKADSSEVAVLRQQVEKFAADKQALTDKLAAEQRGAGEVQARVATLERDLREARGAAGNKAEADDLKNQLAASRQLLEKHSATVAELTGANERLEKDLAAARRGVTDTEARLKAAGEENTRLARAAQRPVADPAELAGLKQQLTEANQALDKSSATVAELTGVNERLERDLSTAQQASAGSDAVRDELAKTRAESARTAADLRAKNDQLVKDSEQLAALMNSNRRDLEAARARVAELEQQVAVPVVRTRNDDESRKLRADLAEANAAAEKLSATVAELTGANERLEKDLETARKSVDAALAAQSQAVSAARPDAYQMEIGTLQARVKELDGQIEDERGNSAKEVSALAAQLARTRETNKSLTEANRALLNAKQSETPMVDKEEFDRLQVRVRELTVAGEDLKRQNARLSSDNQVEVGDRAALQQQLREARQVSAVLPGMADEKAALQERLEAVGAQLVKAQQDVDTLQKENADALAQAVASQQAAGKAQADLATLQARTTDAEKASDSHNAAVAELTEANGKLEAERNDLRRQLTTARAENTRLAQTQGSLEQLKADADRSAQQNIAALSAQLAQVQRDLQSARETNSRIMEGNTTQERDRTAVINQLRSENSALAARLAQAQGTLDQIASAARLGTPAAAIASGGPAPSRPIPSASTSPSAAEARIHTVAEGDSLSRISMRYYGTANRWQEIYNANRDVLQASSTLRVGMQLRIP